MQVCRSRASVADAALLGQQVRLRRAVGPSLVRTRAIDCLTPDTPMRLSVSDRRRRNLRRNRVPMAVPVLLLGRLIQRPVGGAARKLMCPHRVSAVALLRGSLIRRSTRIPVR
ncbi:hypothetical protein EBN03_21360 [Nocardia stercoris]|uniref:Uncharacterized protein n=1 Tax=Nocardia stercoris TaxID=2483361 RepID=A0A3M2L429_9NOCA|nr:hypothetical protein EBN03_21360 [Nocardia stercoris]